MSFVNCLPDAVDKCKTVMYADDTSIMCKANNVHELQSQLNACLRGDNCMLLARRP